MARAITIPVQLVGDHQERAVFRPGDHCSISDQGLAKIDGVRVIGIVENPVVETSAPLVYSSVDISIVLVDRGVSA